MVSLPPRPSVVMLKFSSIPWKPAAMTMFLIRRGFRYVPVTYTGIALLNYAKFLLARVPARAPRKDAVELTVGT